MNKPWQKTRGYQLFTRGSFFLLWASTFAWLIMAFGPGVVFYFDQEAALAEITHLDQAELAIAYFHQEREQTVRHRVRIFYLEKDHGLDEEEQLSILYSKRFPHEVYLPGVNEKPNLSGLFILLVYGLPLLFFRQAEKSFFQEEG
ncbi:MAG: hypothetical protein AAF985_16905 [Bacteroidota bacterium]